MCKSIILADLLTDKYENFTNDQLATRYIELKRAMACLTDEIFKVESQMSFNSLNDERLEGTITTLLSDGSKLKEVRKLIYTVDDEKYNLPVNEHIREELKQTIINKPKVSVSGYKKLEKSNPDLYKICQSFVSVKPAKPSFSITSI